MTQRPPGITDHEWEAMLQYIAIMAAWERAQYQAALDQAAFNRFAHALGFDRHQDGFLHADMSRFRSDVRGPA